MPSIRPIIDRSVYDNLPLEQKIAIGEKLRSTVSLVLDEIPQDIEVIWFPFDGDCAINALPLAVDVLFKVPPTNDYLIDALAESLAAVLSSIEGLPEQGGVFVFASEHAKFVHYVRR